MPDSVGFRLASFAVALLATFGAAFGIGRAVGPIGDDPAPAHHAPDATASTTTSPADGSPGAATTTSHPTDHGEMGS